VSDSGWVDEPTSVLHKHPKTREFVMLENATVRDGRMSFRATGLLAHLISLPQGAPISSVDLAKSRPEGRTAIQSAYRELRQFGYVRQERKQNDDGTWRTTTHVYEVPPDAGNLHSVPDAGLPKSVNLPVSLREKDEEMKEGGRQLQCSACDADGFRSMDELQDHQELECPALRAEDGSFAVAREELRKAGGRG
jgi:hypothetical protein